MLMEVDKNPLPELHLFPRLERVGHFIKRLVSFLPECAPDHMSNHYRPNSGGGPALDRGLYDQQEFDYGRTEQTV